MDGDNMAVRWKRQRGSEWEALLARCVGGRRRKQRKEEQERRRREEEGGRRRRTTTTTQEEGEKVQLGKGEVEEVLETTYTRTT